MTTHAILLSYDLAQEIRDRMEISASDDRDQDDEPLTATDILREMMERCEDREDIYYENRRELRQIQIQLGIVVPLDKAAARECQRSGGASVRKQTDFTVRGVAYTFESWDPLTDLVVEVQL